MRNKLGTYFISSLVIAQLLFAPFGTVSAAGPEEAEPLLEQNIVGSTPLADVGAGSDTAAKLAGNYAGFGSLLGCKGLSARALGGTLNTVGGLFVEKKVAGKIANLATGDTPIGVHDKAATNDLDIISASAKQTAAAAEQEKIRNECLNGLAYRIAHYALAQLTKKTVDWINSGFNGDSFFIKDQYSYIKSIEDQALNEILAPIGLFSNSSKYPYGRDFARAFLQQRVNSYNAAATSNMARYWSKNTTPATYARDFARGGGWTGWLGLTQNPANNPLGFGMMTSQAIADRSAQQTQTALNELGWGDGFLSQKKCVNPENYTLKTATANPCKQWETVTPGIAISNQLSNAMGSSYRQLEMADQMNESMSLVFDALVNQAMVWGVSQLSTRKDPSYATFGGPGTNRIYDASGVDITDRAAPPRDSQGNPLPTPEPGGWSQTQRAFDITTQDLQNVINDQVKYKAALKTSIVPLPQTVPALGALDYCIPGPHPGWDNSTAQKVIDAKDELTALAVDPKTGTVTVNNGDLPKWLQKINTWPVLGELTSLGSGIYESIKDLADYIGNGETGSDVRDRLSIIQDAEGTLSEHMIEYTQRVQPLLLDRQLLEYETAVDRYYGDNNIPIARSGSPAIDMLASVETYPDNEAEVLAEYNTVIGQTDVNISKLKDIQAQVNTIMKQKYIQDQLLVCAAPPGGGILPGNGTGTIDGGGTGIVGPGGGTGTVTNLGGGTGTISPGGTGIIQ